MDCDHIVIPSTLSLENPEARILRMLATWHLGINSQSGTKLLESLIANLLLPIGLNSLWRARKVYRKLRMPLWSSTLASAVLERNGNKIDRNGGSRGSIGISGHFVFSVFGFGLVCVSQSVLTF